jgi:hypothetical protein
MLETSYFIPLMIFIALLLGLIYSLFWFSSVGLFLYLSTLHLSRFQ